jgi:hypothetical protein
MADREELDVRAEVLPSAVQNRVRNTLKKALQDQLAKEAKTLGKITGPDGGLAAIHARSGVSTLEDEVILER